MTSLQSEGKKGRGAFVCCADRGNPEPLESGESGAGTILTLSPLTQTPPRALKPSQSSLSPPLQWPPRARAQRSGSSGSLCFCAALMNSASPCCWCSHSVQAQRTVVTSRATVSLLYPHQLKHLKGSQKFKLYWTEVPKITFNTPKM